MTYKEKRRSPRKFIQADLDIDIDTANLEATGVNLSETGIRFDTPSPLEIDIQFTVQNKNVSHTGRLIWTQKNDTGGFSYAFEFIDKKD